MLDLMCIIIKKLDIILQINETYTLCDKVKPDKEAIIHTTLSTHVSALIRLYVSLAVSYAKVNLAYPCPSYGDNLCLPFQRPVLISAFAVHDLTLLP